MNTISFARGNPSPDILPVEALGECAQAVIAREGRTILNYGPAAGYAPLREWVAAQHGVEASQVVLSTGSLQGFNFVTRHLVRRTAAERSSRRRATTARSASCAASAPRSSRSRSRDAGLDLDALERLLASGDVAEARLHDPDLPESVRTHALARAAARARRARSGEGAPDLRGRPVPARALRRRGAPEPVRARGRQRRPLLVVVLEDGRAPGSASAT